MRQPKNPPWVAVGAKDRISNYMYILMDGGIHMSVFKKILLVFSMSFDGDYSTVCVSGALQIRSGRNTAKVRAAAIQEYGAYYWTNACRADDVSCR